MKKLPFLAVSILALSLLATILTSCSTADTTKLKVVTSTSLIAQITQRVGGDRIDVVSIIPPAQCPGHFDVKPGDIQKLADADLFIMHGWQGEKFPESLVASVNNPQLVTFKVDIKGNWMNPPVQLKAVDEITTILSKTDEKNSSAYQKSAADLKDIIIAKEVDIKRKVANANLSNINVLCSDQQAGFLQWTGLNVIATYDEPETLTPPVIKELIDKGRGAKVSLIVDNLQSGQDAGKGIAEELGAKRITLSNFPGGFDNTDTWEKAIDRNVELILGVLAK